MLQVGDTVKVISTTDFCGEKVEFIPVGTVCKVTEVSEKYKAIAVTPVDGRYGTYLYMEDELEKGHYEWIKG